MQDSLRELRVARALLSPFVAAAPLGLAGCEDDSVGALAEGDAVYAEQDGTPVADGGVGVMGELGYDVAALGLSASDRLISIQSPQPGECAQLREDLDQTPGFGWLVSFTVPLSELHAGASLLIGDDEGAGFADSFFHGPDGWVDSGFACEDDPRDPTSPVTGEIVSVEGDSLTLRIDNLCFIDYGPVIAEDELGNPIEYDDPSDDVLVRADGIYTIQLCGSP